MSMSRMHYEVIAARLRDMRADIAKAQSAEDALSIFDRGTEAMGWDFKTDNANFSADRFQTAIRQEGM